MILCNFSFKSIKCFPLKYQNQKIVNSNAFGESEIKQKRERFKKENIGLDAHFVSSKVR